MAWYDAADLAKEITQMRNINFSIVEKRQQSLQRLGNIECAAPYGRTRRFPEDGMFVCEAVGDWSRKMQQLKSALSYKPLDKDDKMKQGTEARSIDDPSQAFWNATTDMLSQLLRMDGVFDREEFERMTAWEEPQVLGAGGMAQGPAGGGGLGGGAGLGGGGNDQHGAGNDQQGGGGGGDHDAQHG